jgi:hypothetical protein
LCQATHLQALHAFLREAQQGEQQLAPLTDRGLRLLQTDPRGAAAQHRIADTDDPTHTHLVASHGLCRSCPVCADTAYCCVGHWQGLYGVSMLLPVLPGHVAAGTSDCHLLTKVTLEEVVPLASWVLLRHSLAAQPGCHQHHTSCWQRP